MLPRVVTVFGLLLWVVIIPEYFGHFPHGQVGYQQIDNLSFIVQSAQWHGCCSPSSIFPSVPGFLSFSSFPFPFASFFSIVSLPTRTSPSCPAFFLPLLPPTLFPFVPVFLFFPSCFHFLSHPFPFLLWSISFSPFRFFFSLSFPYPLLALPFFFFPSVTFPYLSFIPILFPFLLFFPSLSSLSSLAFPSPSHLFLSLPFLAFPCLSLSFLRGGRMKSR